MKEQEIGRRQFMREGSAVVAAAATVGGALGAGAAEVDPKKILNHNPKMRYRRLGKTNLMLSEVSLGGHWRNRNAGGSRTKFANDRVPDDVAKNRTEVISAAIDCGMNYLDCLGPAENLAYGVALKGRREKMYVGGDNYLICPRQRRNCNVKALTGSVEGVLRRLQSDYLDIWRPSMLFQSKTNTDDDVKAVIETFQKLHEAGKVRHLGMSTHNRPWVQHVVENFPEIEMFIFPCTARTREKEKPVSKDNVVEGIAWAGTPGTSQGVFGTLRKQDVGLVTIKPFACGNIFKSKPKFPVMGVGTKEDNELARLTLRCILTNDAITATIPGQTTVYEVENAARASFERKVAMTPRQKEWLARVTDQRWKDLPEEYQWLRDWEVV